MKTEIKNIKSEIIDEIIEWDKVNWCRALEYIDKYVSDIDIPKYDVLCIGERRGGMSLYFGLKGAKSVICSDIGVSFEEARLFHQRYGFKADGYKEIDVTNDFGESEYDIICFKSVLGSIGKGGRELIEAALENIYKALKPGGALLFMENLEATKFHSFARKKMCRMNSYRRKWYYVKYDDVLKLTSKFSEVNFDTIGFFGAFGVGNKMRGVLGYIDILIDRFIKKENRYIVSCIAIK